MSEYQYYEFQAVDRSLSAKQMDELSGISSRAQITPSSFVNVYNYGDFRGDPGKLIDKYFDAFLYLANWGTRWLMLRVPKKLLSEETAGAFKAGDCFSCLHRGDHVVLSFRSEDEDDYEWAEGEGWLASLLPIRAALMHGDHRALYLGWLLAVQAEEVDEDALEPAVPPGLSDLDASLDQLAQFLRIDTDLITAAAEHSTTSRADGQRRTAAELLERARVLGDARKAKVAEERARKKTRREREDAKKRRKHLESLQGKEPTLWSEVHGLIGTRQSKRYDDAVSLLRDLHDLAELQGDIGAFRMKMSALHDEHQRKTTLVERFRKAKLLGP